tara:strand:+ start:768 stop:1154 length:387 start_codon:yes stop_codon:yes gene_type:complete
MSWEDVLKSISYSAIVLDEESRKKLLDLDMPEGWKPYAHHMTIRLGPLKEDSQYKVGDKVSMNMTAIGMDDRTMAVKVDAKREDTKGFPHVTIAVNPDGGKPFHSNQIKDFEKYSGKLSGVVKEIPNR